MNYVPILWAAVVWVVCFAVGGDKGMQHWPKPIVATFWYGSIVGLVIWAHVASRAKQADEGKSFNVLPESLKVAGRHFARRARELKRSASPLQPSR